MIYGRKEATRLHGLHAIICSRDKTDFSTKLAKGMHGFVRDVDMEFRAAEVEYQGRLSRMPLRNLVSVDHSICLDPLFPLSKQEAQKLHDVMRPLHLRTREPIIEVLRAPARPRSPPRTIQDIAAHAPLSGETSGLYESLVGR